MKSNLVWDVTYLLFFAVLTISVGCGGAPTTASGMTIYEAAEKGDASAVGALIRQGFDINKPDENGLTIMHYAAIGNHPEVIEMLTEDFGANPNIRDAQGRTPLSYARERKNARAARTLVSSGGVE